jgi:hypothetical protein
MMQKGNKKVQASHGIDIDWSETYNRERPEEEKRKQPLRNTCPQGYEKVHFLRRMMRGMGGPHDIYLVSPTMHPIENKIKLTSRNKALTTFISREGISR